MSCDAYDDLWEIFYKLFNKYWPNCEYNLFLGTEYKQSDLITSIRTTGNWTDRTRKALEQITTDYVILLLDDFFIREKVDIKRIEEALLMFDEKTAMVSFQNVLFQLKQYIRKPHIIEHMYALRKPETHYLCNCQPAIWDRKKLISLLPEGLTAWQWETTIPNVDYKFWCNAGDHIINIGYYKEREPWGIVQGKWSKEATEFLNKEKIKVDYDKRGKFD